MTRPWGGGIVAALALQTIVYLKRPEMSAAFSVTALVTDELAGEITGQDLERVAKFLRISDGLPKFDLEYDGQLFTRCRLRGAGDSEAIPFWFESVSTNETQTDDV